MPQLTSDQIDKLKSLGIQIDEVKNTDFTTPSTTNDSISSDHTVSDFSKEKNENCKLKIVNSHSNIFPILSISGLTLLSFSGLILFKNNSNKYEQTAASIPTSNTTLPETSISPTPGLPAGRQVPKSIQHYLLASQQYFTQATQESSCTGDSCGRPIDLLNQSILAATQAIKEFPNDYRGFYQRGRIYQSVLASQPQLFSQVVADLSQAQKLDPTNAEITRSLASAYAIKGDAQNTINYLSQTIALEPTKAQNFYDLALIQQQVGLLSQAVETYNQLTTLISDPTQKAQIEQQRLSLEKLIAQNPNKSYEQTVVSVPNPNDLQPTISIDSPTIQASTSTGLIVAAPEELNQVKVNNLTTSNSLSGSDTLPSNSKDIIITNSQVTSSSQVYVTITKGGKNQNLQVISKSSGSFTVGLDTAISEDIEFKWWIIN